MTALVEPLRFKALAEEWQGAGKPFAGLLFGNQLGVTIGAYVKDLELIAKATDAAEWMTCERGPGVFVPG